MVTLTLVQSQEIHVAMAIIDQAKAYLKAIDVNQWQEGYPDRTQITKDITSGKARFICQEGAVLGYVVVDFDPEPDHDTIQGAWCSDAPYGVIHRLAMGDAGRGRGLIGQVFALVEGEIRAETVGAVRVDTPAVNPIMMHLLPKYGYTQRGTIFLNQKPRLAFDKQI